MSSGRRRLPLDFQKSESHSDEDKAAYLARWEEMNRIVHDIVAARNGSISAEHGIGRMKVEELTHYKSKVELDLMRKIKAALDPDGIMNPGKVFPDPDRKRARLAGRTGLAIEAKWW